MVDDIPGGIPWRRAAAGEHGLAVRFDDIIADETNHRDEIRQILAGWP
jgi:hypothetical protein